jgi:uncharacterized lipoprotein YmbA
MRRHTNGVLLPMTLAVLAGCASTPPSQFYTLSTVADSTSTAASKVSVVVGPVTVPAAVDRPQIVVTAGVNQVQIDEFNRWASPLQDAIAVTLAGDLAADLGTPNVTTLSGGDVQGARYRVVVNVLRFDSTPGTVAVLDAAWSVRRVKDEKSESGRTFVREPLQQAGYGPLAAGHSRAVAQLARDVATAIRSLEAAPVG